MGEACHIIDLFRYLVGEEVAGATCMPSARRSDTKMRSDSFSLAVSYADGSLCNLVYTGRGAKSLSKERMQVFCDGKIYEIDDYRYLNIYAEECQKVSLPKQDKGHECEWKSFLRLLKEGGRFPIPWEELEETWSVTWHANQVCMQGLPDGVSKASETNT